IDGGGALAGQRAARLLPHGTATSLPGTPTRRRWRGLLPHGGLPPLTRSRPWHGSASPWPGRETNQRLRRPSCAMPTSTTSSGRGPPAPPQHRPATKLHGGGTPAWRRCLAPVSTASSLPQAARSLKKPRRPPHPPPPPPTSVAPWRPCSGSPSRRCISDCPGGLLPPSRSTAAVFYPCGRHQIVMALFMASCFHSSSEEASNPYDSPCIGTPRSSWLDVMLPFRLLCPCRYRGLRSRCMVRLLILNVFLIECVYTCYCLIIDTIFLCARFYDCSH
ncbi:unnamed protein product, partial [Urochloa humidicola]